MGAGECMKCRECGWWDEGVVEGCEDGDERRDGEVIFVAHCIWL